MLLVKLFDIWYHILRKVNFSKSLILKENFLRGRGNPDYPVVTLVERLGLIQNKPFDYPNWRFWGGWGRGQRRVRNYSFLQPMPYENGTL